MEAEVRDIRTALPLASDATVWEIGCGAGECALALAPHCGLVYATDMSPAMLDYARLKATERAVPNVRFEIGGFLSGFRPEGPVDAVVSQLTLHHLPDFWKARALDGIAQRLWPQGRLYLRDVVFPSECDDYHAFFQGVVEGVRQQAGDEIAEQTIRHIRYEYSTLAWILEGMIERSGLKIAKKNGQGFIFVYVCEK